MRAWFENLPIQRKLAVITLTSSAVALLLAAGGFLTWDILQNRNEIWMEMRAQSRILEDNNTAPLSFGDARAAGETLAVLRLRPRIAMSCLYTATGQLFATFHRGPQTECPPLPPDGERFGWRRGTIVSPVLLSGRRLGTLMVERDLDDVRNRLAIGGATLGVLLVIATFVGLLVGAGMQRTLTTPLLQLADTARAVSATKDYSLRATSGARDEVGVVVDAFNDMLDRVEEQTTELAHANRLKDEFLATLSHELRTPLNAVLGWVRLLRTKTLPLGTEARALESIERNARAQARLIEDLLEISRIVTGKLRLQVKPTDLAAIVDAAVEVVQPAAAAKRLQVVRRIKVRPAMTSGDPDRLQQVVWNLLSNAVKFTPPGGHITVLLTQEQGFRLSISDTGSGVEAGFLPHIFNPFRQADGSPSREHGGLGLGLAIVRHLVELHGGSVAALSAGPGRGATFEVRLPSDLNTQGPAPQHDPLPAGMAAGTYLLAGVDVLVVDDEEDARELMRMTLDSVGAHVRTAPSASEATRALERAIPDVIISDIGMAVEDGYSLMRRIRAQPPERGGEVPAIALTAYASEGDRDKALTAGYQAHVTKPFEPSAIVALVRELAGTHASSTWANQSPT